MHILRNRKLWLVACGLWLVACGLFVERVGAQQEKPQTQEQQKSAAEKKSISGTTDISLEQRCRELSEKSEYVALSGMVIEAQKSFSPVDCFTKDCHLDLPAHFFAYIESGDGKRFRIRTEQETFRTLYPKPAYMEKGRAYEFCARMIEVRGDPGHSDPVYQIDFVDSIQEITGEQQKSAVEEKSRMEIKDIPLEQRCRELSEKSGDEYAAMSGRATVVEKIFWPVDCFSDDCNHYEKPAYFFARIQSSSGGYFRIYTKPETFRTLHPKPLYMEVGRKYGFCVRPREKGAKLEDGDEVFQIDFFDSIQEITGE